MADIAPLCSFAPQIMSFDINQETGALVITTLGGETLYRPNSLASLDVIAISHQS